MHGINNGWMRMLLLLAFMTIFMSVSALAQEGGMIPLDSPTGEIGGRGHWYSLRTMKGSDYYSKQPIMSDIKEEGGYYSVSGEPPVDIAIVLHPLWGYKTGQPWREALNWVREAEQMFRNSGVPIRFVVTSIETDYGMPDTVKAAYDNLPISKVGEADLLVALLPHMGGDEWCGVATINGRRSVSACSPTTLAHELGHNFGLWHSFNAGHEGAKGYCRLGDDAPVGCIEGTIMSYAVDRLPLFATPHYTYDGTPLGTAENSAVAHLNRVKTKVALASELTAQGDVPRLTHYAEETEAHLCR